MKDPKEKSGPAETDFLRRRDPSLFLPQHESWSNFRAWLVSCVFHTILLVLFALVLRPQTHGTEGEADRPVGIAVMHETNHGNEFFLQKASKNSTSTDSAKPRAGQSVSVGESAGPPLSLNEELTALLGAEGNATGLEPLGTSLSGDGQSGNSTGNPRGKGGPKAKAPFFGIEGTGQSFVYVLDRSDSMNSNDGRPLAYAKRELIKSLSSLNEYYQFQVLFYNDSLYPLASTPGGAGRLLYATDIDRRRATNFIRSMRGEGGTEHFPALKYALSLAPDILFFLTDAEDPSLTMSQLLDIQQRAEIKGTTIHAIQFNDRPLAAGDGGWIRALAEMNRGTYKYLDVTTFVAIEDGEEK